ALALDSAGGIAGDGDRVEGEGLRGGVGGVVHVEVQGRVRVLDEQQALDVAEEAASHVDGVGAVAGREGARVGAMHVADDACGDAGQEVEVLDVGVAERGHAAPRDRGAGDVVGAVGGEVGVEVDGQGVEVVPPVHLDVGDRRQGQLHRLVVHGD